MKISSIKRTVRYYKEKLRPRSSYAQWGEDLVACELLGEVSTFVDVGAYDGLSASNTFVFALRGAYGVCFEPIPSAFDRLRSLYRFNKRVQCFNLGISDRCGHTEMVSDGNLSFIPETEDKEHSKGLKRFFSKHRRTERVKLATFEDAMRTTGFPHDVDLLSIDVEGHELNVLKGIDFRKWRFGLLIIETHNASGKDNVVGWIHRDVHSIEKLLENFGYLVVHRTEGNSFYSREIPKNPNAEHMALGHRSRT